MINLLGFYPAFNAFTMSMMLKWFKDLVKSRVNSIFKGEAGVKVLLDLKAKNIYAVIIFLVGILFLSFVFAFLASNQCEDMNYQHRFCSMLTN